jgi:glyoxylase-like metal-dependent hydrolase (beta-lactamase superfamily II)
VRTDASYPSWMPHEPFSVGSFEIVPLCDGWAPLPLDEELPGRDVDWSEERTRFPWAFAPDDAGSWAWHVHAFLLRASDGTVLVDTGIGHLGPPRYPVTGRIDDELRAVGVVPDDIDHVVYTHLHADHSGGACRADGTPRFPNARHHVHPEDWAFFGEQRKPPTFTGRQSMAGLEDLGLLDLEAHDREIVPGVHLIHAPGHTPGHRIVRVEGTEGGMLLVGDLLHVPPQITHPGSPSNHDEDPAVAARQRTRFVEAALEPGWTVGVSHFGRPYGRVEGGVDGPVWVPA